MQYQNNGIIEEAINHLAILIDTEANYIQNHQYSLPSIEKLKEIVELIRSIVFFGYFGEPILRKDSIHHFLGVRIEKLFALLAEQIASVEYFGLVGEIENSTNHAIPDAFTAIQNRKRVAQSNDTNEFTSTHHSNPISLSNENSASFNEITRKTEKAHEIAHQFIGVLPEIKKKLLTDVQAIYDADPAAKNYGEIIFCYPSIRAMINYRAAHALLSLGVPLIPRIISEMAHSETGIDIHPGAHIGEYFCIDHGTGVVIGETCIIGNHVRLYQGVTLGAKKFELGEDGNPIKNVPRHPIIEDNVVIYSHANILGRITIGKNSVIGGNVWQTQSVPPNSKVLQQRAIEISFSDGLGI